MPIPSWRCVTSEQQSDGIIGRPSLCTTAVSAKSGIRYRGSFTVALVIGAKTSIFSVVHVVLLALLPCRSPDRLMMIWGRNPSRGDQQFPISPKDPYEWQQKNDIVEDVCAST